MAMWIHGDVEVLMYGQAEFTLGSRSVYRGLEALWGRSADELLTVMTKKPARREGSLGQKTLEASNKGPQKMSL